MGSEVICWGDCPRKMTSDPLYPKFPVLRFLHPPVFAYDHRCHGLASLDRRDVEAFDAPGNGRQAEDGPKRFERIEMCRSVLVEARAVQQLGIPGGQFDERSLVAALRDEDLDAPAGARRQPLLHRLAVLDLE